VWTIRSTAPRRRCTLAAFLALSPLASLTACSGDGEQRAEGPRLAAAVASDLAQRSDNVADLLAAGDVCGAAVAADDLQTATVDAINRGRVPGPFQEELSGAVNGLVNEVNCPPPPQPAQTEEDDEEDDEGKGNKKGKKG
jgi:hypothetical protein